MLKLKLTLLAMEHIVKAGCIKGETLEIYNSVFDTQTGIAFEPLDKRWKILKMEIVEYRPLDIKTYEDK